jgi:penicillin-binding protein 1C
MAVRRLVHGLTLAATLASAGLLALDRWIAHTLIPPLALATSVTVLDRNDDLLRAYTVADGRWRLPVSVEDVDATYLAALIAYEDKRFYRHDGVDPRALMRAVAQAVLNGQIVSGGSTLTMQTARLLEEGGTGRWGPKFRQMRLALALERRLDKDQILTLYLHLAPFGGNIEGVRAASLAWFGREPGRLTPAQAALLVALPQSPATRRPDRAPAAAKAARDRILNRLAQAGVLSADAARAARAEGLPDLRRDFPAVAPHLSDRLVAAHPETPVHRLTLDRDLQSRLEKLARTHAVALGDGLSAAILVADHATGEVLATVGSAGYLDTTREGYVDMTLATRSPGSTLKPLIYGLGFDAGIAHPETLIEDKPTSFNGYAPENFDRQHFGTITVRDALRYSLNVPAVAMLDAVGPALLMARMRGAGATASLPGDAPPGLAIALGGIGLTLDGLVTLYGGIANGGQTPVLHDQRDLAPETARRLMSPVAAWQVANILTEVQGPNLARRADIAFKTGTSYGYRDAWAIGFDGAHVIGVWIGRPDGTPVPGILGADTAAPLLFDAFQRLKTQPVPLPPPPEATLTVSNLDLPPPLRRFRGRQASFEAALDTPEIAFPPAGALVDLGLGSGDPLPLVVKVRNGTPPFTWLADGRPVVIGASDRQAEWHPTGPGYVDLTVVDAEGRTQKARVRVE